MEHTAGNVSGTLASYYLFILNSNHLSAVLIMLLSVAAAVFFMWLINRAIYYLNKKYTIGIESRYVVSMRRFIWVCSILSGALLSTYRLGLPTQTESLLTAVLQTLLIITWVYGFYKLMGCLCHQWWVQRRQGQPIIHMMENIGRVIVLTVAIALFLMIWKIDISPILASAGIMGLAVALAAKDTMANLLGGINIFLDKPFSLSDYIILESGERGEVVNIGVRSTLIRTRDDEQISIPNAILANTKIINESAPEPRFRVHIKIGVGYESDLEKVQNALLSVAKANQRISQDPIPRVRFRSFGDSSLDFELLCWAKTPAESGLVIHELNLAIFNKFRKENITIPFPQQDVHMFHKENNTLNV